MANDTLAAAAEDAITDNNLAPDVPEDPGVKGKGWCSRYVRRVVRKVYGLRYDGLFGASARKSGLNFEDAGLAFRYDGETLEAGDILFVLIGSGGFGHVGIFLDDAKHRVAENSSTGIGRISGAKGHRTLAQFPAFQLVGRLPSVGAGTDVLKSYDWYLNQTQRGMVHLHNEQSYCGVRNWAEAIGFELDWDESNENNPITFDGKAVKGANADSIAGELWMHQGHAYLPIRTLAKNAGLVVDFDDERHRVFVHR